MLVNVPVGLLGLYFVDFIGLKKSFWIGTAFNVIGTGFRLGEVLCDEIYRYNHPDGTFLFLRQVVDKEYWFAFSVQPRLSHNLSRWF